MELLSFYEYPGDEFPCSIVLNNKRDGNYIWYTYSLDAYIQALKLQGQYREMDTILTTYCFTDKTDAMQIKLGWDPSQDELESPIV